MKPVKGVDSDYPRQLKAATRRPAKHRATRYQRLYPFAHRT